MPNMAQVVWVGIDQSFCTTKMNLSTANGFHAAFIIIFVIIIMTRSLCLYCRILWLLVSRLASKKNSTDFAVYSLLPIKIECKR